MPRNVLALLIAVALCSGAISCAKIGEPQFEQKNRSRPGFDSNAESSDWPAVTVKSAVITKPLVANAVPLDFLHKEQWQ